MPDTELDELRRLIGCRTQFRGRECRVIEVLQDGPTLVVECIDAAARIQPNQYGDANRRVQQTLCVPVRDPDSDAPHPDYLALREACRKGSVD